MKTKEEHAAYQREWRKRHPYTPEQREQHSADTRAWRLANPEKMNAARAAV